MSTAGAGEEQPGPQETVNESPTTNASGPTTADGPEATTNAGASADAAAPSMEAPSEGEASPPSPASPLADTRDDKAPAPTTEKSERHVAFNPDIQVAGVVFHKEKTQKELEEELDVFGRLYRKTTPAKAAPPPPPVESGGDTATEGASPPKEEAASTPAAAVKPRTLAATPGTAPEMAKVDPKLEKELTACTFKPNITSIAKEHRKLRNWGEFVQLQSDWVAQQKRKKDEALRRQNFDEGVGQPLYDDIKRPHSKKIIEFLEKQHLYKSPQQMYTERAALKQRHQLDGCQRSGSSGSTNPLNHRRGHDHPPRREPVHVDPALFNRLYHEATIREAALRVMEQTQIEKEARELFRPTTNESYWRSSTMLGARTPARNRSQSAYLDDDDYYDDEDNVGADGGFGLEYSVEEELIAKGEEYKRRREERMRQNESEREVCTFKPVMDANSRRILLRKALEQEMDRDDEMWFNDQGVANASTGAECSPPPPRPEERVSLDGEAMATLEHKNKVRFDAEVFAARMQRRDIDRAQKIASLRRAIKLEEVAECTFRPSISKKSNDSVQRHRPVTHSGSNGGTPKVSGVAGMHTRGASNVESYSPDYGRRTPSNTAVAAPQAVDRHVDERRRQAASRAAQLDRPRRIRHGVDEVDALQQGDAYLQHLEDDLRGVIAEWTTISSDATSQHSPAQRR